jgi:AcrR family transcriptional regulator
MRVERKRNPDRRVQRTRSLLHEALVTLLHQQSYEKIAVQDILDQANIGRSTFYTHFRDKDDLLIEGLRDIIRSIETVKSPSSTKWPEALIWFSLPGSEHVEERRRASRLKIGPHWRMVLHQQLQRILVEAITRQVKQCTVAHRKSFGQIPSELLVEHIASTFTLVLNWWVEQKEPFSSREADLLFRSLILPVLPGS